MTDIRSPGPQRGSNWTWRSGLVLTVVALCSWFARETLDRRVPVQRNGGMGWVTYDPDSLYQMRRLERALDEEGPIASHDPGLDYPRGSAIPWPPYYTLLLETVLGPFVPSLQSRDAPEGAPARSQSHGDSRHGWIERRVASMPLLFGVLTSVLAAALARKLAGDLAALVAGLYHALVLASIAYSKAGNGDHHAWVALLAGGLVAILSAALARHAQNSPRAGLLWGSSLGILAGVLLGSWVASIVYILEVQLVLGWLVIRNGREHQPGLLALGGSFHLVALGVSLPAVSSSPWLSDNPWQVVNLSWFHPLFLATGALVFLPLPWLRDRTSMRRAYPWIVLGLLAAAGLILAKVETPVSLGVREGFQWMSKVNQFMAGISESRPLLGKGAGTRAFTELGLGIALVPVLWIWLAGSWRRPAYLALLPILVAVPLRGIQAARQARFGDGLTLPVAVLLGVGAAWLVQRIVAARPRIPTWIAYPIAALLVGLAHVGVISSLGDALRGERAPQLQREGPASVAARNLCEWLRTTERSQASHRGAVLANWSWGHCIEWVAGRPSLATNFGTYVGETGFRDAPAFLLSEDPDQAMGILDRNDAAFVLVTSRLTRTLSSQIAAADPELKGRLLRTTASGTDIQPAWFRTMGARLLLGGSSPELGVDGGATQPLDFLRLVQVSPTRDPTLTFPEGVNPHPGTSPAGFLWERVSGATLEARGTPGTSLTARLTVRFPRGQYSLNLVFSSRAGDDGIARLRIPYATEAPTGNGHVPIDRARFTFGDRGGPLSVPQSAVLEGGTIDLTPGE